MARSKMNEAEVAEKLAELSGWTLADGKLAKTFAFADFPAAMGFMTAAAFEAEKLNHHPNWSNVYDRVEVTLWTHDAGGLTTLDFQLAAAMDARFG